jgi:60 kDa SS-A/Ro ribonucleoprotein
MTIRYGSHLDPNGVPQSEPLDSRQIENNAGGYAYQADIWSRLVRFLILGTDGGSFYATERTLTRENAAVVEACLTLDAIRTVDLIVAVSHEGRAPKNDPAILALAIAASVKDVAKSRYALAALPLVCRIPTHLFHFLAYLKVMRGFGSAVRRAVGDWYTRWNVDQLAYELVKYQQRDGWSHKDVFRLVHPKFPPEAQSVIRWSLGLSADERIVARKNQGAPKNSTDQGVRYKAVGELPDILQAYEAAQHADEAELVTLIQKYGLTREMVPSDKLGSAKVWEALVPNLGLTALMRNLNKMTAVGLIAPFSATTSYVVDQITNPDNLRKARLHPLNILVALRQYSAGQGDKGKLTWKPVDQITTALDTAFYAAFKHVVPTNKNILIALDVSGSMSWHTLAGVSMTPMEASAALALVTAATEPHHQIMAFSHTLVDLRINAKMRLDDVLKAVQKVNMGGTDCSLPMTYAIRNKLPIDAFCVYTDSETWAGPVHPPVALREHRKLSGKKDAALVVVGMEANEFTIADPADPRMLDVVGFDLNTPAAISEFIRG